MKNSTEQRMNTTRLCRKRRRKKIIFLKLLFSYAIILLIIIMIILAQNLRSKQDLTITPIAEESAQSYDYRNDTVPEAVVVFAGEHNISLSEYPPEILKMLKDNPETEEFVLNYPLEHSGKHSMDLSDYLKTDTVPQLMQWDTKWGYIPYAGEVTGLSGCGPICLSMVGLYLTGDQYLFRPDQVLAFAENNDYYIDGKGSKWSLIEEGGRKLGLDVTELPLDKRRIEQNLAVSNPIICAMGPGDFTTTGHFIVLTGIKEDKITINDPNSYENSSRLWTYEDIESQINNLWAIRYFRH